MDNEKMLKAMMQAVTNAVVDVNADEVFDQLYPKIEEKIHQTCGFLPEIHEIRSPEGIHKIVGTTHEKFDEVANIVNLDIPVYLTGKAGTGKNVICQQVRKLWVWIFTSPMLLRRSTNSLASLMPMAIIRKPSFIRLLRRAACSSWTRWMRLSPRL